MEEEPNPVPTLDLGSGAEIQIEVERKVLRQTNLGLRLRAAILAESVRRQIDLV